MKYFFLLAAFACIKCTAQSTAMVSTAFDSLFSSYFTANEPGGAILLVKDNKVVYKKGFGIADIHSKEAITPQTLFNVGSISKTFVAYGILKLAKEGKLSLDDDLYKYFPDFKNKAIAEKVKLYHLLTHTSGIPDSRRVSEEKEFYLTAKDEENFAPLKQTDSLQFEPGTKYRYSNPAFNGLALIIEKVTGKKWQSYIKENIFKPAGMEKSTITDGPHPASGVSHGYIKNKDENFEELDYGEEPTFAAAGNGGVWSSVEELWKYEKAIHEYRFLDSNWIKMSRTVFPFDQWKDELPQRLGLSWFLTNDMGLYMVGHTGSQGGFISDYCWLPEHGVFYVLLCNTPKPIKEIRTKLFSILERHKWLDK
jgi:CubicO group peptidase (beta-lactamase class C family)